MNVTVKCSQTACQDYAVNPAYFPYPGLTVNVKHEERCRMKPYNWYMTDRPHHLNFFQNGTRQETGWIPLVCARSSTRIAASTVW